jgi:hypothetical protein
MKAIPFLAKRPKLTVIPVGSELTGVVYLQKQGFITPNENPVDFQEQQKKQRKFFTAYNGRVKELAKELNLSQAEVRTKLAGLQTGDADPDAAKDAIVDTGESFLDYLDESTLELMYSLQADARTLAIRSATYMLQHRAAVAVVLREDADPKSRELKVEPLSTPVGSEDIIRFYTEDGSYTVAARGFANYGSEVLEVKDTPCPFKKGAVGYLCDKESAQVKIGFPDWTVEDTENFIGEELIAELYRFYQIEAGEAAEATLEGSENEVESEAGEADVDFPLSTGGNSTIDSSTLMLETSDLTSETLATKIPA